MDEQIQLSVIVPVFNEEGLLWEMTANLVDQLDRVIGKGCWEFIFVENGSTDGTPDILARIVGQWSQTKVISLPKSDYGAALRAGLLNVARPWSHVINIEHWDSTFLAWAWKNREHYDLFLGSKLADPTINQQSRYRRFLSWGLNTLLRLNFHYVGADTHGLKLVRMDTITPVVHECIMKRGQFDTELVLRSLRKGLWVAEAPVEYVERRPSRNFMIRKIVQNLWDQIGLFRAVAHLPYTANLNYHRYARDDLRHCRQALSAGLGDDFAS